MNPGVTSGVKMRHFDEVIESDRADERKSEQDIEATVLIPAEVNGKPERRDEPQRRR